MGLLIIPSYQSELTVHKGLMNIQHHYHSSLHLFWTEGIQELDARYPLSTEGLIMLYSKPVINSHQLYVKNLIFQVLSTDLEVIKSSESLALRDTVFGYRGNKNNINERCELGITLCSFAQLPKLYMKVYLSHLIFKEMVTFKKQNY